MGWEHRKCYGLHFLALEKPWWERAGNCSGYPWRSPEMLNTPKKTEDCLCWPRKDPGGVGDTLGTKDWLWEPNTDLLFFFIICLFFGSYSRWDGAAVKGGTETTERRIQHPAIFPMFCFFVASSPFLLLVSEQETDKSCFLGRRTMRRSEPFRQGPDESKGDQGPKRAEPPTHRWRGGKRKRKGWIPALSGQPYDQGKSKGKQTTYGQGFGYQQAALWNSGAILTLRRGRWEREEPH